jgi:hypothetical protein
MIVSGTAVVNAQDPGLVISALRTNVNEAILRNKMKLI